MTPQITAGGIIWCNVVGAKPYTASERMQRTFEQAKRIKTDGITSKTNAKAK